MTYINEKEKIEKIYRKGAERASKIAEKTIKDVYNKIGLVI